MIKRDQKRNVSGFRARVVAGSNVQKESKDFGAVHARVFDLAKALLTELVRLSNRWGVQHVDVKIAFLNCNIDRYLFVYHPYNLPYESKRDTVYEPYKALYGLRQVSVQWLLKLTEYSFHEGKFQERRSKNALCIRNVGGDSGIISACVNDLLFFGNTAESLLAAIAKFLTQCDGSAEPLKWYPKVHFKINNDSIQFSKISYIQQAIEEFDLQDMNTFSSPMAASFHDDAIFHERNLYCMTLIIVTWLAFWIF